MAKQNDIYLIIGRKNLLTFLKVETWSAITKMIKDGCPIGKIGGRWSAQKHLLIEWLTEKQTRSVKSVKIGQPLPSFTDHFSKVWSNWRRPRMDLFLDSYVKNHCCVNRSCREANISRITYYNWRKQFERFDLACSEIEKEVLHGKG